MGRPSLRSPALEQSILERLASGEPLAQICRDDGMPHPNVWRRWCDDDEELSIAYARARDDGFDQIAMEALRIADTPVEGERIKIDADGEEEIIREDMLGHRKLQIETRLKLLAKWDPRRYGDLMKLSGPDGKSPVAAFAITAEMTPQQAAEAYAKLIG